MNDRQRATYHLTMAIIILMIGIILAFTFFMVYPFKVIEFNDDKFPVENEIVRAGEYAIVQIDLDKNIACPAQISKQLVNSIVYTYPVVVSNYPVGNADLILPVKIPEYAETGLYHIIFTYVYHLGFRELTYSNETVMFNVIGGD